MTVDRSLKFVIVGHVDHGKSTLIGRLLYDTGALPPDKIDELNKSSKNLGRDTEFAHLVDQLEEERRHGITIDTTQVFFNTGKRDYVIIDAPGHVEFVKNMITGASQAEAAVLIVDVTKGVEEQTKRHAYFLSLLGLNQVIIALNKMDLVRFNRDGFEGTKSEVQQFLDSVEIHPALYIPMSAISGDNIAKKSENMDWYEGPTFLGALDGLESRESSEDKPLIFPVQDVYEIEGKRIAVGRVEAGIVQKGAEVKILPGGEQSTISSIDSYSENREKAVAGECIGITLKDPIFLERGNIACLPTREPILTNNFSANIFWLSRKDLLREEKITIRCSTQETSCKVETIKKRINSSTLAIIQENAGVLKNLEVGEVIIKTKKPIAVEAFGDVPELGRFVLVRSENICAGGITIV